MARDRIPRGEVLQAAYGVLDKYKMNRAFFIQTEQNTCETLPPPVEAVDEAAKKSKTKPEVQTVDETKPEEIPVEVLPAEKAPTTVKAWVLFIKPSSRWTYDKFSTVRRWLVE